MEECSICLGEIEIKFYVLDCDHILHEQCFKKWYKLGTFSCPECKGKIDPHMDFRSKEILSELLMSDCAFCNKSVECDFVYLFCQHAFHMECIAKWCGLDNDSCPNCRKKINSNAREIKVILLCDICKQWFEDITICSYCEFWNHKACQKIKNECINCKEETLSDDEMN